MLKKIKVIVEPEWLGKFAPCDLEILTRDGRRLTHHAAHTPGTPENPMSMDDLKDKFSDCASTGVSPMNVDQCNNAIKTILAIETVRDMAEALDFGDT